MRLNALCLTAVLIAVAAPLSAGAVPAGADCVAAVSAQQVTPAGHGCPLGYYWEPDGYAPHGKFRRFRPAHCAPR